MLAPATYVAGRPYRGGLRIDLPATAAPVPNEFVTPPGASAPPPAHVLEASFGDQVRLLGYDLPRDHVARGGQLDITIHFQALAPAEGGRLDGCRLFVHLIGPGTFTNLDHAPAQGTHPVPHWRPGETIRDRFTIPISMTAPPGTYTLLTGFWRPAGRLPITPPTRDDGEGRFRVLTFRVD